MKIYVVCENDECTTIHEPEIFTEEEKALTFLREKFLDKLALEELFDIGKWLRVVAPNAEFSEDAANKTKKDVDKLLQTHSLDEPYYTFDQREAYIEYPGNDCNYWHIELFEKEI